MFAGIKKIGLSLLLSVFCVLTASAQNATIWEIDKSQSAVNFAINNFFVSVKGEFTEYEGDIHFDPNNLKDSKAKFTISINSINTGSDTRDKHLQVDNFFDAENYPEMTFKSTKFEKKSDEEFLVYGKLTIKGSTKDVVLPMKITGDKKNSLKVEIETTLDRKDYGVGTGFWSVTVSIGNEVRIHIPLKLDRKNEL